MLLKSEDNTPYAYFDASYGALPSGNGITDKTGFLDRYLPKICPRYRKLPPVPVASSTDFPPDF